VGVGAGVARALGPWLAAKGAGPSQGCGAAVQIGRAVVLLGGGVCMSGLVLSAPSLCPQLIPSP
jgi:hypothetical protein